MATFIAQTYTGAEDYLAQLRSSITGALRLAERARLEMKNAEQQLIDLTQPAPVGWDESRQYVNAQAATNPDNVEWQTLKGRQDQMQADFIELRNVLDAVNEAIDENWTL